MSTPSEPDNTDDAAWRAIVENYGERPDLGDLDTDHEVPGSPREIDDLEAAERAKRAHASSRSEPTAEPEDHYVPPPPPPIPHPDPPRMLAWVGLFGVPAFVLVSLLARIDLPPWAGLLLMVWFVGGFVYLVASMRPGAGDDDDYDDGAVL